MATRSRSGGIFQSAVDMEMNPRSSGVSQPMPGQCSRLRYDLVRSGHQELRVWERECELDLFPASALAFFNHHDVVHTLAFQEACDVGNVLDHTPDDFGFYICSHGQSFCRDTFDRRTDFPPLVSDTDGQIFVDYRDGRHNTMDIRFETIERRDGHFRSIHIRGHKGHAAQLFDVPSSHILR